MLEYEVDEEKFKRASRFCVYLHHRPDGSVYYVGKGLRSRATDFAPSRCSKHHQNVTNKYGRENIKITTIPAAYEFEAFMLEKAHIAIRPDGLVNLTKGGEGCIGRKPTAKQLAALEKGRKAKSSRIAECVECRRLFLTKCWKVGICCSNSCNLRRYRRRKKSA